MFEGVWNYLASASWRLRKIPAAARVASNANPARRRPDGAIRTSQNFRDGHFSKGIENRHLHWLLPGQIAKVADGGHHIREFHRLFRPLLIENTATGCLAK